MTRRTNSTRKRFLFFTSVPYVYSPPKLNANSLTFYIKIWRSTSLDFFYSPTA